MPTIKHGEISDANKTGGNTAPPPKCDGRVKTNLYEVNAHCDSRSASKTAIEAQKATMYRCSACGVVQESGGNPPSACVKCDNEKFYRVK